MFTGMISGNEIAFTRDVQVRPGGTNRGAGVFGVAGALEFVAKREQ